MEDELRETIIEQHHATILSEASYIFGKLQGAYLFLADENKRLKEKIKKLKEGSIKTRGRKA